MKSDNAQIVGLGLIAGAAIGYALGLIAAGADSAPLIAAVGAGLGVVAGAMVRALGRRDDAAGR
jgi:hypothetical protein